MKHTQFAVLLAALLAFTACSPEPQVITQTLPEYVTAIRGTGTYEVYHLQHTLPDSYTDTENPASPENYEVVKDDTQEKELSEGSTIDVIKNDYPGFSAVSMTQNGNAIYVYYDRNTITYIFKAGQPEDSDVKGTFADGTTEIKRIGLFGEAVEFDPPEVPNYTHEVKGWKPELPSTFGAENTEFTAVWGPPLTIRNGVLIKCNPNVKGPVTIPEGVTSIGYGAFDGCSGLTSVTIPASVTSIGNSTFSGCSSLTSVTIPDGVTSIGDRTFYNCSSLTSVTIPTSVTSIGDRTFDGCSSLTSVNIPDGVTSIGDSAFYNCSSLTSVTIPEGVTSIGDHAFYWCSSLTSVTIPEGVTSIGDHAFSYCSSLTTVEFNGTTTQWATITKGSDWNYKVPAKTVTCSDGTANLNYTLTIKDGVLTKCTGSANGTVIIPEGVTSIGDSAFRYCNSLTSVTIPASVSSIGSSAFSYCSSLTTVNYNGTTAQWAAITKGDSWSSGVPATTVTCSDGDTSL